MEVDLGPNRLYLAPSGNCGNASFLAQPKGVRVSPVGVRTCQGCRGNKSLIQRLELYSREGEIPELQRLGAQSGSSFPFSAQRTETRGWCILQNSLSTVGYYRQPWICFTQRLQKGKYPGEVQNAPL